MKVRWARSLLVIASLTAAIGIAQEISDEEDKKHPFKEIAPGLFWNGAFHKQRRCPETIAEWQSWLQKVAEVADFGHSNFAYFAKESLDQCLHDPKRSLNIPETVRACLTRLDQSMNLFRPETEAVKKANLERAQIPKELITPEVYEFFFEKKYGVSKRPPAIFAELRKKGWVILERKGMIQIPGPPMRVINLQNGPGFVDVIHANPIDKDRFSFHAVEYIWELDPIMRRVSVRPNENAGLSTCMSCHTQGFNGVDQGRWGQPQEPTESIRKLNESLYAMGRPDFGTAWTFPETSVPSMGGAEQEDDDRRTDAWIESCGGPFTAEKRPTSVTAIRKAMRCSRCHDGDTRPRLTYPMRSPRLTADASPIGRRPMPPHALSKDPKEDEQLRKSLGKCLEEEYYGKNGLFRKWITEVSCDGTANASVVNEKTLKPAAPTETSQDSKGTKKDTPKSNDAK